MAQNFANAVIDRVLSIVFAIHFEINAQCRPTRPEIWFPLQFHIATCDGQRPFTSILIIKGDGSILGVPLSSEHTKHGPFRDGWARK